MHGFIYRSKLRGLAVPHRITANPVQLEFALDTVMYIVFLDDNHLQPPAPQEEPITPYSAEGVDVCSQKLQSQKSQLLDLDVLDIWGLTGSSPQFYR